MPWQSMAITCVHRRSFAEPPVHGGTALAMPKFVPRESIGRLKKPHGTVALRLSDSFEYLWYWSTVIINNCTLTVRGSTLDVKI